MCAFPLNIFLVCFSGLDSSAGIRSPITEAKQIPNSVHKPTLSKPSPLEIYSCQAWNTLIIFLFFIPPMWYMRIWCRRARSYSGKALPCVVRVISENCDWSLSLGSWFAVLTWLCTCMTSTHTWVHILQILSQWFQTHLSLFCCCVWSGNDSSARSFREKVFFSLLLWFLTITEVLVWNLWAQMGKFSSQMTMYS